MSDSQWHRVDHRRPCPICGPSHKRQSWCLVHESGEVCICPRVSDGASKDLGEAGWLHRLVERPKRVYELPKRLPTPSSIDWRAMLMQFRQRTSPNDLQSLGDRLGVSADSLDRLGAAVERPHVWAFPMTSGNSLCGMRLRHVNGEKWAVRGSRSALFVPQGRTMDGPLVICEGPTDTAAMLDMGYDAVGRPSCLGGVDLLRPMCAGRHVAIMADDDGPGWNGANRLAAAVYQGARTVRVVRPHAKDAREWKRSGATRRVVDAVIGATEVWCE